MTATLKRMTVEEWRAEGLRRFGANEMQWRFVCPSCSHIASVQDWKDAGAGETAVAFSCVGRWTGATRQIFEKPGPCNYAGGGLFGLNPITVALETGEIRVFEFADSKEGEG